jgi:hypothetical protein
LSGMLLICDGAPTFMSLLWVSLSSLKPCMDMCTTVALSAEAIHYVGGPHERSRESARDRMVPPSRWWPVGASDYCSAETHPTLICEIRQRGFWRHSSGTFTLNVAQKCISTSLLWADSLTWFRALSHRWPDPGRTRQVSGHGGGGVRRGCSACKRL